MGFLLMLLGWMTTISFCGILLRVNVILIEERIDYLFIVSSPLVQIAAIKVVVANMTCRVVDRAIQVYGGMGVCQDTPLAGMYAGARSLRIADGPDIVHTETVAKLELKSQLAAKL